MYSILLHIQAIIFQSILSFLELLIHSFQLSTESYTFTLFLKTSRVFQSCDFSIICLFEKYSFHITDFHSNLDSLFVD